MTYRRVIPRDLFNEANLLKCYAQLWLKLEGNAVNADLKFLEEGDVANFLIYQNENDGSIFVGNVSLFVRGVEFGLFRPLNSRGSYPLWLRTIGADIPVFTEDGEFTQDMKEFLNG